MKSNLKIFHEESIELEMLLKNKINLLQSPINFLNEKEVKEIKNIFLEYSKKVEKLINSANDNTSRIDKESNDIYENIIKKYKQMRSNIEKYIEEYEEREAKKLSEKSFKNIHRDREESISDFSEYADKDKLEIIKIFLNSIMTVNHVTTLQKKKTLEEEKNYILEIFNLKDSYPNSPAKQQILVDLYTNNYKFCVQQKFTIEKISTFMSIVYFIFTYSVMNKKIIKEKTMNLFREIIEFHSLNRPPYCYEIFTNEDKVKIFHFCNTTLFRNYTLIESIFKYNVNIYFTSKDFKKIPKRELPQIKEYQLTKEFEHDNTNEIQIIHNMYLSKIKINNNENNNKEIKSDLDKYEEETMEKLKTFVNSFYKSKTALESEKLKEEQSKLAKEKEHEIKEVTNYLEKKVPEIVNEASERIMIANKDILKTANTHISNVLEKKK